MTVLTVIQKTIEIEIPDEYKILDQPWEEPLTDEGEILWDKCVSEIEANLPDEYKGFEVVYAESLNGNTIADS